MDGDSLAYCSCNTCSGKIEFDVSLMQSGSVVVCPHCGIETALYIQKNNLGSVRSASKEITQPQIPSQDQLQAIDSLIIIGGTDCPSCNSAQTQRLEMAFTMGISKKQGSLVGVDLQGDIGVGGYGGTSQTALSIATSPPKRKQVFGIYLIGFLLGILFYVMGLNIWNLYLGLVFFGGCLFFVHKLVTPSRKYNAQIYPRLIKRWLAAWICLRCGRRWIPQK